MPTDGTDFARMRACYGKFCSATKQGSPEAALAGIALEGLARDVRRDGGLPAFRPLVDLLTGFVSSELSSGDDGRGQLLDDVDRVERQLADSSLTREACAVARRVGLKALNGASNLSRETIVEQMVLGLARSRCLDRASLYVTRHQADALAHSLSRPRSWEALCVTWPGLLSAEREIHTHDFGKAVETLLQRHVTEWRSFSHAITGGLFAAAA